MQVTDPVCGETIDLGVAEPAEYLGWAYFFCSDACRSAFLTAPDRYTPSHGPPMSRDHVSGPPRSAQ